MFKNYGLMPGDRLTVRWGKEKVREIRDVTVVAEYDYHILVDIGAYQTSLNKADLFTGEIRIKKIGGNRYER